MQRLIDKRCAIKHLKELLKNSIMPTEWYEGAKSAITRLQKEPTVDAVEVVRCKDCRHWIKDGKICCGQTTVGEDESSIITGENDFCSMGERWSNGKTS